MSPHCDQSQAGPSGKSAVAQGAEQPLQALPTPDAHRVPGSSAYPEESRGGVGAALIS